MNVTVTRLRRSHFGGGLLVNPGDEADDMEADFEVDHEDVMGAPGTAAAASERKRFLDAFECPRGGYDVTGMQKCSDVTFAKKRPKDPNWIYNKKIGVSVIYGELTLIFHNQLDIQSLFNFKYDFFVGGELAAFFVIKRFEVAAAYIKIFAVINATRTHCTAGTNPRGVPALCL